MGKKGKAGAQAAPAERPLTPAQVAQLTGVEWATALLGNDKVIRALCLAEFSAADKNQNGELDRAEAIACVTTIATRFRLELPKQERMDEACCPFSIT